MGTLDDYYLLAPHDGPTSEHRIPLASFDATRDLVKDILKSGTRETVMEISSEKSGLAVQFDSNRKYYS